MADAALRVRVCTLHKRNRGTLVCLSPCTDYVLAYGDCETWTQMGHLFETTTGNRVCDLEMPGRRAGIFINCATSAAWAPAAPQEQPSDGCTMLAIGYNYGVVRVWLFNKMKRTCHFVCELRGDSNLGVESMAWSPAASQADGSIMLATTSGERAARVWRVDASTETGEQLCVLDGHANAVSEVAWSPSGRYIATVTYNTVYLWLLQNTTTGVTGQKVCMLRTQRNNQSAPIGSIIGSITWSPCSEYLAAGFYDNTASVWRLYSDDGASDGNINAGQEVCTLRGHTHILLCVAWSPCGKYIATGSADNTVRVWLASGGMQVCMMRAHNVHSVAWSPCSSRVVACTRDGSMYTLVMCKWTPRTHRCFTPTARQLALRIMCARDRLLQLQASLRCRGPVTVPPLEIWLLVFEIIFAN